MSHYKGISGQSEADGRR